MKQYKETDTGSFYIDNISIPAAEGNRHYQAMLKEVAAGEATIVYFVPPAIDPNDAIKSQIYAAEETITNRRLREAVLTPAGKAWLVTVDANIATLRGGLIPKV